MAFFDNRNGESETVSAAFEPNHALEAYFAISRFAGRTGTYGALRVPQAASRHSYRWWIPPTLGMATTSALPDGLACTGRGCGESLLRDKWQRSS